MTLVKRNPQSRKRSKSSGYKKRPRSNWLKSFQVENKFFLSAKGGVKSFDKSDITEKNTRRYQFLVKLFSLSFHLSAFEVTFVKTSKLALCRQKELVSNLKVVHK